MNSFPRAFTSRLSPLSANTCRIALSSVTTVMMTSDSAVTCDKSWHAAQPSSCCQFRRRFPIHIVNRRDVKPALLQSARHVRAHPANANESNIHIFSVILSEAKDLTSDIWPS